jgi:hypothetical protein
VIEALQDGQTPSEQVFDFASERDYYFDSGSGVTGDFHGNGYGDGRVSGDARGDGGTPNTPADLILACPEPADLTYTLVNTLCRMES